MKLGNASRRIDYIPFNLPQLLDIEALVPTRINEDFYAAIEL
jgi:hypothetical protein